MFVCKGRTQSPFRFISLGKYNEIPWGCSWGFLDIRGAGRSISVDVQVGAPTPFGFANPGKYNERHGSVRECSRISHLVGKWRIQSPFTYINPGRYNEIPGICSWVLKRGSSGFVRSMVNCAA